MDGNLFGAEAAGLGFIALEPDAGGIGLEPVGFAEACGEFGRGGLPVEGFDIAIILQAAFLEAEGWLRSTTR